MKNRKFLSVLVTLAVLFGCMNGVVLADTEIEEVPETSEEQIEETEEESEPSEETQTESEETEETDSEQPEESEQDAEIPDEQETEESDAVEIEYEEFDSADDVAADAYYINRTWNGTEVVSESEPYTGTSVKLPESGGAINGWFYVDEDITVDSRLLIASGNTVNLVLVDGVTVTVNGGIDVPDGATLHIYGQSRDSGNLIIQNVASGDAGIGGNSSHNNGDIFIHGGDIDVTQRTSGCGAGIGNGNSSDTHDCGSINIYGGDVHVELFSSSSSAGIGGGTFSQVGDIRIYGGVIYSQGGNFSAGIGSGLSSGKASSDETGVFDIEIFGGTITALGGESAAGIGMGALLFELAVTTCNIGTITISGGRINSTGGANGAGIGIGNYAIDIQGTIEISGGTVTSYGGNYGAGIGLGRAVKDDLSTVVSVSITGGTITAFGSSYSSAIGTGLQGNFADGTVTISDSSVSLYASLGASYIGPNMSSNNFNLGSDLCVYDDHEVIVLRTLRANTCLGTAVSSEPVRIRACEHGDGDWAYADDDYHAFTCHYCSYTDSQPHNFIDEECLDCGYIISGESPAFIGHQMLLSGDIVIRYWVTLDNDISDLSYITFEGQRMTPATHYPLIQGDLPDYEGETFYVDLHISSIQMAENFTPTLHYPGTDSEKSIRGAAFSAQDYLHYGKTHFAVGSDERGIVDALADYGYYAQTYLSLQNSWTPGEDYASIDRSSTVYSHDDVRNQLTDYVVTSNIDPDLFESCSFALRFGDQLTMNIYFTPKEGATIDIESFRVLEYSDYTVSYTGGRYVVTISGISVSGCDRAFRVIYNDVDFVSVSPLSFAYAMLCQSGYSAKTMAGKDLVCALYTLYEACRSN